MADVLLAFAGGDDERGVVEVARRTGLSPAVTHRIMRSLASRQLLAQDPTTQQYRLGHAAIALGARATSQLDLRGAARPELERLARDTGETATISALTGLRRVYLDQVTPPMELRLQVEVGRPFGLGLGSTGRAILAFLPDHTIDAVIADLRREATAGDVPFDERALRERLDDVRAAGIAISRGERIRGAAGVAAPVRGGGDEVVGAINIIGPVHRMSDDTLQRYGPLVVSAAARVGDNTRTQRADGAASPPRPQGTETTS